MNRFFYYIFSAALLTLVIAGACRDDDLYFGDGPALDDGAIRIGAKIDQPALTRTYIESGPVKEGKFLLTYPYYYNGADAFGIFRYYYHYGEVTFGYQGQETTGFVNVGTATAPKSLIWSPTNTGTSSDDGIFVYPSANPSPLVLDNFMVRPGVSTAANAAADTIVSIASSFPDNPFKAGIFDKENGTNDLLWGKVRVKTGTPNIDFDMSHRMTRVILNVIVEKNGDDDDDTEDFSINLENASVTLTKVLLEPLTYMRLYGDLLFQERINVSTISPTINESLYKDYQLVIPNKQPGQPEISDGANEEPDQEENSSNPYTWAKVDRVEGGDTVYTTQDFVFAPQILRQGTQLRPRIIIAVPKEDVNKGINPGYGKQDSIYFSGNVPVTMYMNNGDDMPPSLQTLNFDGGKVITLTTKMKPGEMELEFAPVTVEPWVYKGTFNPTAKQSGIYSAEDLYTLIDDYYQKGDLFWLRRFGYIEYPNTPNEQWRFMINSGSLEFEAERIVGTMIPDKQISVNGEEVTTPNFIFDFRSRDEYYLMPDGTKVSMGTGSKNLDDIVKTPANTGVASAENFGALIEAYQKNFWQQFVYGTYSHEDKEWTFRITDNVTLDYNEIAASMLLPESGSHNFKFEIENGYTVTVNNKPTGNPTVDATQLYDIVTSRIPGLYADSEFTSLINAIKSNNQGELNQYGTLTDGTWTFPLKRNISISSEALQGALNGSSSSLNYQFDNNGFTLTMVQYGGTSVTNPTSEQLKTIMNLKKPTGLGTYEDFQDLINAYNQTPISNEALSEYGYYILPGPTWIFFFTEGMTLDRSEIQGSMVPDADKPEFSFNLNYKQIMFKGEEGDGITGQNGAKELLDIVSTPKTNPDPGVDPGN